ncbi:MAG TPA: type II toxin-antitoxin system RelE/ParE family toxin [Mucilaginibacter sp.]
MYRLIVKENATRMAQGAYLWYEGEQLGLGELFLDELERCYNRLEEYPLIYAKIKRNFRQVVLRKIPYVVVFEIFGNDVIVYAVFHTSRDPKKKFKK